MFRKFALTLCAAAALGAAALMPTAASARHGGSWHGHSGARAVHVARVVHHPRVYVRHPVYVRHRVYVRHHYYARHRLYVRPIRHAYASCLVRRVISTPVGPRVRLVNRCLHPHIAGYRHALPYYR